MDTVKPFAEHGTLDWEYDAEADVLNQSHAHRARPSGSTSVRGSLRATTRPTGPLSG